MSLSLYEEALLEAIKIKDLAEENAKKAVLEYLNPKIKKMVEEKLYSQTNLIIQEKKEDDKEDDKKHLLFSSDDEKSVNDKEEDIKDESSGVGNIAGAMSVPLEKDDLEEVIEKEITQLEQKINVYNGTTNFLKNNEEFVHSLNYLMSILEDKFQNLEKKINNKNLINNYKMRLESMYETIHELKENCNMKQKKEEEVVEELDIDVVLDDEDEELEEAKSSDESDDMEECLSEEDEQLDDEDIVEVSEEDLKKEIADLKSELSPKEDEEEVVEEASKEEEEPSVVEEESGEDEAEEEKSDDSDSCEHCQMKKEMKVQQMHLESKTMWLTEAKKRAGKPSAAHCKKQAEQASKKLESSKKKVADLKKKVESKVVNESSKQEKAIAEKYSKQIDCLEKALQEAKLNNQKLIVVNKLLQLESLSQKQKKVAVEQLEQAETTKEIKMVYESFTKALVSKKPLSESVLGSSSRSVKSTSTLSTAPNSENLFERWEVLAGIK